MMDYQDLVTDAAEAVEVFGDDALEEFAAKELLDCGHYIWEHGPRGRCPK